MKAYDDEIFVRTRRVACRLLPEAVAMVNANQYGNGVAIFTRDGNTARSSRAK